MLLVSGLALLWSLANSRTVDRYLSRVIDKALKREGLQAVYTSMAVIGLCAVYQEIVSR